MASSKITTHEECGCKRVTEHIPRSTGTREVWAPCLAHAAEDKIRHDQWLADYRVGQAENARRRANRQELA